MYSIPPIFQTGNKRGGSISQKYIQKSPIQRSRKHFTKQNTTAYLLGGAPGKFEKIDQKIVNELPTAIARSPRKRQLCEFVYFEKDKFCPRPKHTNDRISRDFNSCRADDVNKKWESIARLHKDLGTMRERKSDYEQCATARKLEFDYCQDGPPYYKFQQWASNPSKKGTHEHEMKMANQRVKDCVEPDVRAISMISKIARNNIVGIIKNGRGIFDQDFTKNYEFLSDPDKSIIHNSLFCYRRTNQAPPTEHYCINKTHTSEVMNGLLTLIINNSYYNGIEKYWDNNFTKLAPDKEKLLRHFANSVLHENEDRIMTVEEMPFIVIREMTKINPGFEYTDKDVGDMGILKRLILIGNYLLEAGEDPKKAFNPIIENIKAEDPTIFYFTTYYTKKGTVVKELDFSLETKNLLILTLKQAQKFYHDWAQCRITFEKIFTDANPRERGVYNIDQELRFLNTRFLENIKNKKLEKIQIPGISPQFLYNSTLYKVPT